MSSNKQRIRVDTEVWRVIQEASMPLTDTPNSVLRRLLGLDKPPSANATKIDNGTFLDMDIGDVKTFLPAIGETFGGLQGKIAAAAHRFGEKTNRSFITSCRHSKYHGMVMLKRTS